MTQGDVADLAAGVRAGSRQHVARAITLLESTRADHRERAAELLTSIADATGGAVRVGISGVPGAGKSTFINAMGCRLVERGHRVAVVAVDPTSRRTGGSILGDRTRMAELAASEAAFTARVAQPLRTCALICSSTSFALAGIGVPGP